MDVLGIDIGGSGIKGALVNTETGELTAERFRLETPQPATPEAMVETTAQVVAHFDWNHKTFGCGFPAAVQHGVVNTASNIDKSWIGKNAEEMLCKATGAAHVRVGNDADVAGLAEIRFGAGKDVKGVVLMITLGTGIGSGLFVDGKLVPNTEFGHLNVLKHGNAERWASDAVRDREELKWGEWAERIETYMVMVENLFWPDLIIVGGGVSKKADKWLPQVKTRTRIVVASMKNEAGIVGAALLAAEQPEG